MYLPKASELYRRIRQIVKQEIQSVGPVPVQATGSSGIAKGIIPATHVSGNPKIQRAHETSTTLGSKTYKVQQPAGNRNAVLVASDSIAYWYDPDGNKAIPGKLVDNGSTITDAEYLLGVRPVAPGNTLLLTLSVEQSTTSASFVTVKRVFVSRPGRYRIKFKLSRSGGQTDARVGLEFPDGTIVAASSTVSYASTVFPAYSAEQTADMTITAVWGTFIVIQLLNSSGPVQTGFLKDCTINYSDASASLSVYDSVLTD